MAIVLALIIVGWLVAFAFGSQTGFDNKPVAVAARPSVNKATKAKSTTYEKPMSAA
ncbi:MAG: hypothetical protein AAFN38_25030 [Cyanobacteria bacterium J06560_5]